MGKLFLIIFKIFASLPLKLRGEIGSLGGFIYSFFPSREKEIARLQLKLSLPDKNADQICREMFKHIGKTLLEAVNAKQLLRHPELKVTCSKQDLLDSVCQNSNQVICLTAHLGSWDLLAAYGISKGIPIAAFATRPKQASAEAIIEYLRDSYGLTIFWRSDKGLRKQILECINSNKVLAALIDQDTRVKSIHCPFFWMDAATPSTLVKIAKKNSCRLVTGFMLRKSEYEFELSLDEIDSSLSVEEILLEYNRILETNIKNYPEQWVWFHKRWRTLADGKKLSSKEYLSFLEEKLCA